MNALCIFLFLSIGVITAPPQVDTEESRLDTFSEKIDSLYAVGEFDTGEQLVLEAIHKLAFNSPKAHSDTLLAWLHEELGIFTQELGKYEFSF